MSKQTLADFVYCACVQHTLMHQKTSSTYSVEIENQLSTHSTPEIQQLDYQQSNSSYFFLKKSYQGAGIERMQ